MLFACPALAYTGEKLATDARVSIAEARAIALKAHPGKITDEKLEHRRNRPTLFIRHQKWKSTQEVGVDARTGRVLENAKEGKHPD
ncbi:MAG: PepSY domain-containing protein [Methylocella sp.]